MRRFALAALLLLPAVVPGAEAIGGYPVRYSSPVWSPDSASVVLLASEAYDRSDVERIDIDTSRRSRVGGVVRAGRLAVSARGQVAVTAADDTGKAAVLLVGAGRNHALTPAAERTPVAWSPDGRYLAYTTPAGELATIAADGTHQATLAAGSAPSWSPDGASIAFVGRQGVSIISTSRGTPRIVAPVARGVFWSPDGERLLLDNASGATVVDVATGATAPVRGLEPAWSPDGSSIVVVRDGLATIVARDGADPHRIASRGGKGLEPSWSPDGKWIAFELESASPDGQVYQRGNTNNVVLAHPDGSGLRGITGGCPFGSRTPPDWVCLVDGRFAVPAAQAPRPTVRLGTPARFPRLTRVPIFVAWSSKPVYRAHVSVTRLSGPGPLQIAARQGNSLTDLGGRVAFDLRKPYRKGRYLLRVRVNRTVRVLVIRL